MNPNDLTPILRCKSCSGFFYGSLLKCTQCGGSDFEKTTVQDLISAAAQDGGKIKVLSMRIDPPWPRHGVWEVGGTKTALEAVPP